MLNIGVVGPGCKNCHEVKSRVVKVLTDLKAESTIQEIKEYKDIAASGVMMTPGLIVNGKVVSQGRIPSEEQIRGWVLEAMRS